MPLPTLLSLAFGTGIATAIAGRVELRVSPRPALLTRGFASYLLFAVLVLVPISVYFYVFHGDWFLLYLVDVRRVPSAVALLGFVGEALLGTAGFGLGAILVRSQRETLAGTLVALSLLLGGAVVPLARDRLAVVGSYAQYRGGFGLTAYGSGPILQGTLVMGGILVVAILYLILRLHFATRRGG